jgi:hypothetical protein
VLAAASISAGSVCGRPGAAAPAQKPAETVPSDPSLLIGSPGRPSASRASASTLSSAALQLLQSACWVCDQF